MGSVMKGQKMKMILMVCVVMLAACGQEPVAVVPPAPPPPTVEEIALKYAQTKLAKALKAPATARYPLDTIEAKQVPPFIDRAGFQVEQLVVTGGVDAENEYGALLRGTWRVTMLETREGIIPVQVDLNGEVVFTEPDHAAELAAIEAKHLAAAQKRAKEIQDELARQREEDRLAEIQRVAERIAVIPKEIEEHKAALAKLGKRPPGGPILFEFEKHEKAIAELAAEQERLRVRALALDAGSSH